MNQFNETNVAAKTAAKAAGKKTVQTAGDIHMKVKTIAFVGLMGAVSAVLMLFRFPIPFMPPFMSFDLSGLMEMMGGFMFGPFHRKDPPAACDPGVFLPGNGGAAELYLKFQLCIAGSVYLPPE